MNKIKSHISVLIPDSQDHKLLVLQVVNCLSLHKNIKIYVMSSERHNYLKYSRFVKYLSYRPEKDDKNWISNINREVEKYEIDVIMPVFEFGIKRLIENKNQLKEKDKLCVLPDLSKFNTAGDKGLLYLHLKANGFPCPNSVVTKPNDLPDLKILEFPIIAKPVTGFGGGKGIKVLYNNDDVIKYSKSNTFSCNAIYQNFINGYDLCCNVLCDKGEVIAYSIQNASVIDKYDVEPQIGFHFIKDLELIEIIKKIMKSLDWSGVANIDCRYDEKEDLFKIIEINTRYWINVDASAIANVNFPYLHCLLSKNIVHEVQETNNITYFNLKGLVRQVIKKPAIAFNIGYLKNNTPLMFALKDPLPILYKFVWRTKNVLVRKIQLNTLLSIKNSFKSLMSIQKNSN
jgi:predicted ATP-grasp superfamily ATP-dependent carboligase